MGAINSVPRWNPFGPQLKALPPSKPAGTRRPRRRGDACDSASMAADRGRRASPSPDGGSVTGMGERSNSKIMGQSAPVLYENALVGEWSALRSRAASHPSEAEYADRRCNSAIHLVCRRQPNADVVGALLKADPAGANRVTADGMTPLHFAAYCGAEEEVVRLLLEAARENPSSDPPPEAGGEPAARPQSQPPQSRPVGSIVTASTTDRRGRTPLHLTLSGFRTSHRPVVVALLLRSDPSGATRADERGRTPLGLLYDDYAEEVEDALSGEINDDEVKRMCLEEDGELHECWTILNTLLKCAYYGTVPEIPDTARAAAKSAVSAADGQGRTNDNGDGDEHRDGGAAASQALARRTSSDAMSGASQRLAPGPPAEVDLLHGPYRPLHAAVGVYETPPKFVRLLLRAYPRAAEEEDGDFNLPLHVAARAVPAEHKRQRRGTMTFRGGVGCGGGGWAHAATPTGVVMKGTGRASLGASSSGSIAGGGAAAPGGRVYNADFGRGSGHHHHHSHGGGASSSIHRENSSEASGLLSGSSREGTALASDTNRRKQSPPHTAISDLLHAFPAAASIPDESGKFALVLAIQSGKNWTRDVRPILDAYPEAFYGGDADGEEGEDDGANSYREAVRNAIVGALGSPVRGLREETVQTVAGIAGLWRRDDDDTDADEGKREGGGGERRHSIVSDDATRNTAFDNEQDEGKTTASIQQAEGEGGSREDSSGQKSPDALSLVDELVQMASGGSGSAGASISRKISDTTASAHGGGSSSDDDWAAGAQSASLDALAGLYACVPAECIDLPDSAQTGLDVALEALRQEDEAVRESAARCLGAALELLGAESAMSAMRDLIDQHGAARSGRGGGGRRDVGIVRSFSGSALSGVAGLDLAAEERTDDESDLEEYSSLASRHGRAAAVYRVLSCSVGSAVASDAELFRGITRLIRDLVLDEDVPVRRAACQAVGGALWRSRNPTSTLREVRRAIGKCMRVSEDGGVHSCLARGLIVACKNENSDLFLCKAGMPILDGALMLSVSSAIAPPVQRMFHGFMWLALEVGSVGKSNSRKGLEKYMRLAEGENGRIMKNLVNKTLSKIEHVKEYR